MIHHIVLYKLKPETTPERVEKLLMQTRMQLLKIPVAMNVRCGRRIDQKNEWPFFLCGRVRFQRADGHVFRGSGLHQIRRRNDQAEYSRSSMVLDYETDPKRKYS